MCSDSCPIPFLSLFLYHPYIPHFLFEEFFYFLVSFLFYCMHACTHYAVTKHIGHINHSKRPSLSHSVSKIGVHLAIQLDSSMGNSYLVVVCCLGVLMRYWQHILMYDDGVCCCLHVMYIHCKKNFFNSWGQYLVKVGWLYLPALSCYVQKYVLYLPNCNKM